MGGVLEVGFVKLSLQQSLWVREVERMQLDFGGCARCVVCGGVYPASCFDFFCSHQSSSSFASAFLHTAIDSACTPNIRCIVVDCTTW